MAVSGEVAAALAVSGLANEAQGCLGALSEGEGGVSFDTLYGGALWTGPLDHFPTAAEWPGGTGPTGQPTSALGFLQFERATYAECTAATGLAGIDPQSQIANGWWLAQHDFAKRTGGGALLTALQADRLSEVSSALLSTWPGGAGPGFSAAYTAFLATLAPAPAPSPAPAPAPTPTPAPPAPLPPPVPSPVTDPVATALAAFTSAFSHLSADVGLAVAKIGALPPDPQTIATQINDITTRVTALSDSIEQALAQGATPSFRSE